MDIQDFIKNLANQFDDPDSIIITPSTEFKKLDEWNSLAALSVICMIDEEYGIAINGESIRNANTVQDLFDIISKS